MATVEETRYLWGRPLVRILRMVIAVLACIVISGSVYLIGFFLLNPDGSEEWTIGRRPNQYFTDLDYEQRIFSDQTYGGIFGVAHNSGGSIEAILEAQINGADVIEADIVELDGVLHVAHKAHFRFWVNAGFGGRGWIGSGSQPPGPMP